MTENIIKRIDNIKDILAILIGLEFIIMFTISSSSLGLKDIMVMLLPIGISSIVWNRSLYISLMDNKDALYAKSKMSYELFIFIGFFLALITVVSFAFAIIKVLLVL